MRPIPSKDDIKKHASQRRMSGMEEGVGTHRFSAQCVLKTGRGPAQIVELWYSTKSIAGNSMLVVPFNGPLLRQGFQRDFCAGGYTH